MRPFLVLSLLQASASAETVDVGADGSASSERFTDTLAAGVGPLWASVINHKFTDELAAGTLDKEVLKCYLIRAARRDRTFTQLP